MIDLAGLELGGISRAGVATCLVLPSYKVAVDIGRCLDRAVRLKTILITHAHADHLGGIASHAARRALNGMPPASYVVPPGVEGDVEDLLGVWRRLDGDGLPARIVPLAPDSELQLRRDLVVRPFRTQHPVRSQGYVFLSRRHRLKAELQEKSSGELAELRRSGAELEDTFDVVELAVAGDTRLDAVLASPAALAARRLVIEVTFLDERVSVAEARAMGHTHLDEVIENADALEAEVIVFTHFSERYRRVEIRELLAQRLPPGLAERVVPFLPHRAS